MAGLLGSAFAAENFAGLLVDGLMRVGMPVPEYGESFLCAADGFQIEVHRVENHRIMDTTLTLE